MANKKNSKKVSSNNYIKDVEKTFLVFRLLSTSDKLQLLKNALEKSYETKKTKESLVYLKNEKTNQILLATDIERLTQFELENLISKRAKNVNVLKIICNEFTPNLNTNILNGLTVEIIDKKKFYDKFFLTLNMKLNCSDLTLKNESKKFKEYMRNFLQPHKSKPFFLCGLVLIFSSIILPYHYYYLIFGSLFLILSLVCKILPLFQR